MTGSARSRCIPRNSPPIFIDQPLAAGSTSAAVLGALCLLPVGGAFGFRESIAGRDALVYAHPALAREHILLAASRQFQRGGCPALVASSDRRGNPHADIRLISCGSLSSLRTTSESRGSEYPSRECPFLDALVLKDDQDREPSNSGGVDRTKATLLEHCQRALTHSQKFGAMDCP